MNIKQLHNQLSEMGIPEDRYYLHGLYDSTDDNDKIALTVKRGKYTIEYETYYRECGSKHSERTFTDEHNACMWILQKLRTEHTIERVHRIEGLGGMTVNERLHASGLMEEFDAALINDKIRTREILRCLGIDEQSINSIIK